MFAVLPTIAAVEIAGDDGGRLALAFGLSTALAAIAYTALFVALSVATRNAVILGLLYALLWETVLGGYVPGIRAVSVRQWALSVGERTLGKPRERMGRRAEVGVVTGVVMLIVATVAATFIAVRKLQTLRLARSTRHVFAWPSHDRGESPRSVNAIGHRCFHLAASQASAAANSAGSDCSMAAETARSTMAPTIGTGA